MKTITDPRFEDHHIQIDDYNYSVYKNRTSESGKQYSTLVGHYPNMHSALKSMATSMTCDSNSIKEYVDRLESIYTQFENLKLK